MSESCVKNVKKTFIPLWPCKLENITNQTRDITILILFLKMVN